MPKSHHFQLRATFGPADVLALLKRIAELPRHAPLEPAFSFDWLKRRAALSANSPQGVATLLSDLRNALAAAKVGEAALLIGKTVPLPDGRHEAPIGIAVMDAAIFAELIVQGLAESGVRGINLETNDDGCLIRVPLSLRTQGGAYDTYITQFPVPPYIKIHDLGIHDAPKPVSKKGKR